MDMSLSKLQEMVIGKPGRLQSMGSQRVGHDWATEQQALVFKIKNLLELEIIGIKVLEVIEIMYN